DLEVQFPAGAFETRPGAVSLGRRVEGLLLHAYLGAVTTIADQAIRRLFAQVAASEADQLAFLAGLAGPPIGDPFPSVHGLPTASEGLAVYLP
ncbi:MAG: ferritin-like domain-containing protein, partial [Thermoleophilia bacterium]